MSRHALFALAAATLAACSPPGSKAPATPGPPVMLGPLPPPAPWSIPFLGRQLAEAIPQSQETCTGHIDGVMQRFAGPPTGAQLVGWGWDKAAKRRVERVILTDASGKIVGGGDGGLGRPDVPKALPDITDQSTGWVAHALIASGDVAVYGVIDEGRAVCPLGTIPS